MVLHEFISHHGKSFEPGASAKALASFVWPPVAIEIHINEKEYTLSPMTTWRIMYFGKLVIKLPFINHSRHPCVSNGVISI